MKVYRSNHLDSKRNINSIDFKMKTTIKLILTLVAFSFIYGCSTKPVKTITNLTYAYYGESTASAKYAAFAEQAKSEGFDTIAIMFMATSKSEAIHAENHKKVLEKLGEKVEGPQIGSYEVLTTVQNLTDAVAGESGEIDSMYPGFIAVAESEKCADAVKSFTWALDTEKKHRGFYQTALNEINAGGEKTLPSQWMVCPLCGNTYNAGTITAVCDFCMTTKELFITF
jgi:rubrerythrin